MEKSWKLKDIIMMGILGVLFAVIYMAVVYVGLGISTAVAPLGLSDLAFEPIYGVWFMAATLAAYIIRKPGVALVTELLAAFIELLMGNHGGLNVVLTGIIQGGAAELGFALFRYKKWNLSSMTVASCFSAIAIFIYELWYLQYYMLTPGMLIAHIGIRLISAFIFSALICKLAGDGLAKTGVVKSYAIGSSAKNTAKVYDEEN